MRQALVEARKGLGRTSPNPCVGAVVVRDGSLIAKGFHRRAGEAHAEVNALRSAGEKSRGATLYVTLEPCNHTGRTPPCTRAILASGIRRVVVGMPDPNPHVVGGGSAFLTTQGVVVDSGILAEECRAINRPFIKLVQTGLPWVIMKAGVSLDGRIARIPGVGVRVTGERSGKYTHRLRNQVDAILVGIGTVLADDPALTTRLPSGRGRSPLRIILDTHLRLPLTAKVLAAVDKASPWVFCGPSADITRRKALESAGARVTTVAFAADGSLDLRVVLAALGAAGITSLLVEGGGRVHAAFLGAGLVDEAAIFLAPVFFGAGGVPLINGLFEQGREQIPRLQVTEVRRLDDDVLVRGLVAAGRGADRIVL